ncbi:MAG: hypothetical protein K6E49_07410 [Lachnospiraceae bacterium]|nr:hypothetical protein [Lachnospiraceae bacterium]
MENNDTDVKAASKKKVIIIAAIVGVLVLLGVCGYLVYRNMYFIEINLPKEFAGGVAGATGTSGSDGIEIRSNEDGSVTYRMPRSQHEELMTGLTQTLEQSLDDMATSDNAVFSAVSHNPEFTEFTVTCKSDSLGLSETISRVGLYYIGSFYNIYNGTPADNIKVIYLAPDGSKLAELNSSDDDGMGQDQIPSGDQVPTEETAPEQAQ